MPEARFPSNANQLSAVNSKSISVIIVTSLRPKGRPLSVRQQRLAEFRKSEACRQRRKEANRREKLMNRKAFRDQVSGVFTAEAFVSATAPCQSWLNESFVYPAMEQSKDQQFDDVRVLFPARDLIYSDSEAAVLSSCSSWCAGPPRIQDPDSSTMDSERFFCTDEKLPPRPYGRVGVVDGPGGIGDRYLNKPPDGYVPSEDLVSISEEMERKEIQKPFRQVWHSLWEHHVRRDSVGTISAKRTKHVSQLVSAEKEALEAATASVTNVCLQSNLERKQRRGIFHGGRPMIETKVTYQSRAVTRPWGRAFHHRGPSMCTRSAQRKVSLMRDDGSEDAETFDKKQKSRRCELSDRKIIPRTVIKTASRLRTAVLARKKESNSSPEQTSSPPTNPKRGASGSSNNRSWQFKPIKPTSKTRITVQSEASRNTGVSNLKETNTQKSIDLVKELDVMGRMRSFRYRGMPVKLTNTKGRPLSYQNQNASPSRDSRQSVHFNVPERNRLPSLPSRGNFYSSPMSNQADPDVFDTDPDPQVASVDGNTESKQLANELEVSGAASQYATPRRVLRSKPISKLADRGFRGKSTYNANRFYGPALRQSTIKSSSPHVVHPSYRAPAPDTVMPPHCSYDLAVSPDVLYDRHPATDQAPTAFRFSHPNAPDVLISPPPNPQFVDTLCGPNSLSENETPVSICNTRFQAVHIPHYYGLGTPDMSFEKNYIPLQPLLQQSVPFRSFVPSIDLSRFAVRPHPRSFLRKRDDDQVHLGYDKNSPFLVNLQHVGNPPTPYLMSQSEKTPKPLKTFLTFGAQVPSSTLISNNAIPPKKSSSSPEEMQSTNNSNPRDTWESNLANVVDLHDNEEDGRAFNHVEITSRSLLPTRTNECPPFAEKALRIATKEHTICNLKEDVSPKTSLPKPKATDPVIEAPQTCGLTVDSSRAHCDSDPRRIESINQGSEPRNMISAHQSDSKLSTVPEGSVDVLLTSDCHSTDARAFEFNSPYAPNSPNIYTTDIDQTDRSSQRIGDTDLDTVETKKCMTIESTTCENTISEKVFTDSEKLASSEPSPYDQSYGGLFMSPATGLSDITPSNSHRLHIVRSFSQQTSDKETSFEENTNTRLDGVSKNNAIATEMNSIEAASPSIRCSQPVVSRLDNLSEYFRSTEDSFSESSRTPMSQTIGFNQAAKVERRDACVQVPVLCTQCVETEQFTSEKGVPDGRAGLDFKLMSILVDVPPVIKRTESVGINTEGKPPQFGRTDTPREESVPGPTAKQDSDSRLTLADQLRSTSPLNARASVDDGHRSVAPVPAMDKEINRLKPFFKSHCHELANVYNLAAAHSVNLDTKKVCPSALKELKLRTDSNASNEIRKDKRSGSTDDERSCRYEHEQPGRTSKQLVGDRRVSFRPFRKESDMRARDVLQDERPKHQGMPVAEENPQKDEIRPQVAVTSAKELRKLKRTEKLREEEDVDAEIPPPPRMTDFVNAVDRPYEKSVLKREKSSSSIKPRRLSEHSRLSSQDLNADVMALKRKPGCAFSKKIPSPKKKGILKISSEVEGKIKPLDIPGSIIRFGLSNIVTTANVYSKEAITFPATSSEGEMSEIRTDTVRNTVSHLQKITLESFEKSKPVESDKLDCPDGRSSVIIHDSSIENLVIANASQNGNRCASTHPIHTNESTVRTICLHKFKNRGESVVKSSPVQNFGASIRDAFTEVELVSEVKDSENVNSNVDRSCTEPTSRRADVHSKTVKNIPSTENRYVLAKTAVTSKPHKCVEKTVGKVKAIDLSEDSKEDPKFFSEITPDPKNTTGSDVINTFDSAQWTGGCMFTAMRRFMKNRPHSASSAQSNGRRTDCDNGYPGFQVTGVPAFENQRLSDSRKYNRCKYKHMYFKDWSPTASAEDSPPTVKVCRSRTPMKCTTSASRIQKCCAKPCDAGDLMVDSELDEDVDEFSSSIDRGHKSSCAKNRHLWQSVYRRRREESTLQSPLTPDPYDSDDFKSESSEGLCSAVRLNISDNFCSCNVGLSCPETRQFSKHIVTCVLCNKKDSADKSAHGIRTLPSDRIVEKVFETRNPRGHRTSRSSVRATSAPAGQVRVSPVRCWPPAHSVYKITHGPRRLIKHVKLLQCDSYTCERCAHRKVRQRIPSRMYDDQPRNRKRDDVLLMVENRHCDYFDDGYGLQCSCCASRRD